MDPVLPIAGYLLNEITGQEVWPQRLVALYAKRQLELAALEMTITAFNKGEVSRKELEKAFDASAESESGRRDNGLLNRVRARLQVFPTERLTFPLPKAVRREFDLCRLEWMNCIGSLVPPTVSPPKIPNLAQTPRIEKCPDEIMVFTLHPASGEELPPHKDPLLQLVVVGKGDQIEDAIIGVRIRDWNASAIEAEIPADPTTGCLKLCWFVDLAEVNATLRRTASACQRFFGLAPEPPPFMILPITDVSIPSHETSEFSVQGKFGIVDTVACVPFSVEWLVTAFRCDWSQAQDQVELERDGIVVLDEASMSGEAQFSARDDTEFTLRVKTTLHGKVCHSSEARVSVHPSPVLSLMPSRLVVDSGEQLASVVVLSCPAPAGGLRIDINSTHPERLQPIQLDMPAGRRALSFTLSAGRQCGSLVVTATAQGYKPSAIPLTVVAAPRIVAVRPSEIELSKSTSGQELAFDLECVAAAAPADPDFPEAVLTSAQKRHTLQPVSLRGDGDAQVTCTYRLPDELTAGLYELSVSQFNRPPITGLVVR